MKNAKDRRCDRRCCDGRRMPKLGEHTGTIKCNFRELSQVQGSMITESKLIEFVEKKAESKSTEAQV